MAKKTATVDDPAETAKHLAQHAGRVRQAAKKAQAALTDLAMVAELYDAAVAEAITAARTAGTDTGVGLAVELDGKAWHRVDVGLMLGAVLRRVATARLARTHQLNGRLGMFDRTQLWRLGWLLDDLPPVPEGRAVTERFVWPGVKVEGAPVLWASETAREDAVRKRAHEERMRPVVLWP